MGRRTKKKKATAGGGSSNIGIDATAIEEIYKPELCEKESIESFLGRGGKITMLKQRKQEQMKWKQ